MSVKMMVEVEVLTSCSPLRIFTASIAHRRRSRAEENQCRGVARCDTVRDENVIEAQPGVDERDVMPLFVIERNFAEQLDVAAIDHAHIRAVNDDAGVRWVYSFLSADKKKTYCLYEAANADALRDAAARLGMPADVIIDVEQFGPMPIG
jgi:Protein of unknown function (DUF4242)